MHEILADSSIFYPDCEITTLRKVDEGVSHSEVSISQSSLKGGGGAGRQ